MREWFLCETFLNKKGKMWMCLGMQRLIPLISFPFKCGHTSNWLILERKHLPGFFLITLNQAAFQGWIFECFVCQDYFVLSVNRITRLSYLKDLSNIPKEKDHLSLVSHDLSLFPTVDSVAADGWTDRSDGRSCGTGWSGEKCSKLVFFICFISCWLNSVVPH